MEAINSLFFRPGRLQILQNILRPYETADDININDICKQFYKGRASKSTKDQLQSFILANFENLKTKTVVAISPVAALAFLLDNCAALEGVKNKNSRGGYTTPKMQYIIHTIFALPHPPPTAALEILKTLLQKANINDFVPEEGSEEEAKELLGQALRLFPPFWHEIKPKIFQKKHQKQKRGRKAMQRQHSEESSSTDASTGAVVEPVPAEIDVDVAHPSTESETELQSRGTAVDQLREPAVPIDVIVHRCADGSAPRTPLRYTKRQATTTSIDAIAGPSHAGRVQTQVGWDDILTMPTSSSPVPDPPSSPEPIQPAPIQPAPIDPVLVHTPIQRAPIDPVPVHTADIHTAPIDPVHIQPAPIDPVPDPIAANPGAINVGDLVWAKARFMSYWIGRVVEVHQVTRHTNYVVDLEDRGLYKIQSKFVKKYDKDEPIPDYVKPGKHQRDRLLQIIRTFSE